jgi:hypothetical protein
MLQCTVVGVPCAPMKHPAMQMNSIFGRSFLWSDAGIVTAA